MLLTQRDGAVKLFIHFFLLFLLSNATCEYFVQKKRFKDIFFFWHTYRELFLIILFARHENKGRKSIWDRKNKKIIKKIEINKKKDILLYFAISGWKGISWAELFLEKSCSNQVYGSFNEDTPTKIKRKLRFISVFPTDITKKRKKILFFFLYSFSRGFV